MMPDMMAGLSQSARLFLWWAKTWRHRLDIAMWVELASAEFLVDCDMFMTETTRFSHIIPVSLGETMEYTNSDAVSRVRKIKAPVWHAAGGS
jgi:anaerobic selenocysteine-containing dehydrogenase